MKNVSELRAPDGVGERGTSACPMPDAESHHTAGLQTAQTGVGKLGGGKKGREHFHRSLQFRIGHQRQINQAFNGAPVESLRQSLAFALDLLLGGVSWQVDAESAQASKRGSY